LRPVFLFLLIQNWRLPGFVLPLILLVLFVIGTFTDKGATTLVSTLATFGLIVYLQGPRARLPIRERRPFAMRGFLSRTERHRGAIDNPRAC
jgi:preprotein translocase subunit SecY